MGGLDPAWALRWLLSLMYLLGVQGRRRFDSGMWDVCNGAAREAKEGRKESHKNIITCNMHTNGFIVVHGGFPGWGIAWQHVPGLPLLPVRCAWGRLFKNMVRAVGTYP